MHPLWKPKKILTHPNPKHPHEPIGHSSRNQKLHNPKLKPFNTIKLPQTFTRFSNTDTTVTRNLSGNTVPANASGRIYRHTIQSQTRHQNPHSSHKSLQIIKRPRIFTKLHEINTNATRALLRNQSPQTHSPPFAETRSKPLQTDPQPQSPQLPSKRSNSLQSSPNRAKFSPLLETRHEDDRRQRFRSHSQKRDPIP
ncbi:hypothetical protein M758_4G081500 [Ceratodon purpureus]|nr:hypothetical protein M758_4G081500 [Ceratodon purpureus]